MKEKLSKAREYLQSLNCNLFFALKERKALVSEINILKELLNMGPFDHKRELELYKFHFEDISKLSIEELLAFSLIIESHSAQNYPKWSKKIHLAHYKDDLFYMINPVLLFSYSKELFFSLELSDDYKFLLSYLS